MKAVHIEGPGRDYRLITTTLPRPQAGPGQVLIQVRAAGLNRPDLMQAYGLYPPPPGASPILGLEVSGRIAEVGEGAEPWKTGDKVCALLTGGGYGEFAVADAGSVLPVPDSIELMEAAGLPECTFTAWTNVMDAGRLAAGESLLVHGGTSGIGSLAIQIFADRGHRILTTVGSEEKCEAARKLGAVRAINYHQEDFVTVVKSETGGKGVDVILDMVGGDYVQRNIEAAAQWGRIVNIAFQSGFRTEVDFTPMLAKKLSMAATLLRPRTPDQKRAIRDALLREVWPRLGTGIKPVTDRVFPLEQAQQAHEYMAKTGHIGKILLQIA